MAVTKHGLLSCRHTTILLKAVQACRLEGGQVSGRRLCALEGCCVFNWECQVWGTLHYVLCTIKGRHVCHMDFHARLGESALHGIYVIEKG